MFGFSERTTGEKVVMVGAGALLVTNTALNIVNTIKAKNLKKRANMFDARMAELDKSMAAVEARIASQQQQQVVQPQPITPPPVVEQPQQAQNQETK